MGVNIGALACRQTPDLCSVANDVWDVDWGTLVAHRSGPWAASKCLESTFTLDSVDGILGFGNYMDMGVSEGRV